MTTTTRQTKFYDSQLRAIYLATALRLRLILSVRRLRRPQFACLCFTTSAKWFSNSNCTVCSRFLLFFSVLLCNLPNDFPFARADCRGLEVRLDGAGPLLPLAVHAVLCLWDLRHHLSVAVTLWHPRPNRSPAKRDSSAQKQFHAAPGHREAGG